MAFDLLFTKRSLNELFIMVLYIRNMVCHRCKMAVESVLQQAGIHPANIALGEVTLLENEIDKSKLNTISSELNKLGFELIDDKRSRLIEQIKTVIISTIHYSDEQPVVKFSELLSSKLHHDYSYLSKLFSDVEGVTIEQYIIGQKIEKVKELMTYDELSLNEIAFKLGYSSTAHLSNQFKKITGLSPSQFKQAGKNKRNSLDQLFPGK